MSEALQKILKGNLRDSESALDKYASLLHILLGEEEFILNQYGLIIGSNLEAVNVTGYEEYEIIGKHISIFYLPEELEKAASDLEKAKRIGSSVVTGLRLKKRGVCFWAKMKIKFIPSSLPDCPCFKVILQDATHRAISKERIRTLRDEYLSIFNNPFVGTLKFKMDSFAIQMCNQKTLDILDVESSSNLRLDHCFSSLHDFERFISALQEEKKLEGFQFLIQVGKSGKETWAVISARYFESHGFAEGVLMDISDQHKQMQELQRVNSDLDNFIYHASHDLRSPLTSIMGLVNLGLKENSVADTHGYLSMIRGRIDHLDALLKDLISVYYNNKSEIKYEPFHFQEELDSILKLLKHPDQYLNVVLEITQQTEFHTDVVRMRSIIRNLISNAFKYYNPNVLLPSLHLNIRVGPSHCAILLKDNGVGIHPIYKHKVFDMFFRATNQSSGSGLGLYIVKAMVEKLRGRISFESTLNIGTTFLLTIPNELQRKALISNPVNSSMLTSRQIELVENSWDSVMLNAMETGTMFYKKLFSIDPGLRQLFKGDIQAQSQKLVAMITFAVHKLSNLEEIITDVKSLGTLHQDKFVKPGDYETVATALLWTLEKNLGNEWNDELKDAWMAVYKTLSKIMIAAAEEKTNIL